jgi:hypothetical protein
MHALQLEVVAVWAFNTPVHARVDNGRQQHTAAGEAANPQNTTAVILYMV